MLKVLVACECSGIVRDAFVSLGHYAMSADLKPCLSPGEHYQGDVFDLLPGDWDLLVGFPPCTYLAKAQMWRYRSEEGRIAKRNDALCFFDRLMSAAVPSIALENPVGWLNSNYRKPDQIIYPWMFGDPYHKEICIWLKNCPPVISTCVNTVRRSVANHTNGRMSQAQKAEIKSSWKYYPMMAQALASQWSASLSAK